jgi:hypothetical protein
MTGERPLPPHGSTVHTRARFPGRFLDLIDD